MFSALWSLFNIAALVYVVVLCFKATKIIRDKFGVSASILVTIIVLSFLSDPGDADSVGRSTGSSSNRFVFVPADSTIPAETSFKMITLETNRVTTYELGIWYGKDIHGTPFVPIRAFSSAGGLVSGIYWRPESIIVNRMSDDGQFSYIVSGTKIWRLLGISLYHEAVLYRGSIKVP